MVKIKKQQIFNFFKSKEIVKVIKNNTNIVENNNIYSENVLKRVKIINLNSNNIYYELNPENPTYIKPNKPTEKVIIEVNKDYMNVIFIEMKPMKGKGIQKKLERTFSWLYLLFNLLKDKEDKQIKVFYVLCKYSESSLQNVVCKDKIDVFHNLRVKYIKKIYYSNGSERMELDWNELISIPNQINRCQ